MKNKKTIGRSAAVVFLAFFFTLFAIDASADYYQIKVYHFKTTQQEERLDKYFKDAFIPALHKAGISDIGICKLIDQDTDRRIFVLIPLKSLDEIENTEDLLSKDRVYVEKGKDYINAIYNDYPYTRIENIIVHLFASSPKPVLPDLTGAKTDRVYELRSYENPDEKAGISKTKMFETGEMQLFDSLQFHAVFYGKVIAGSRMPNLMYLTTFNNMSERDQHWDLFKNSPTWKAMAAAPEYQHNMDNRNVWLLHPASYSDF